MMASNELTLVVSPTFYNPLEIVPTAVKVPP